MKTGRIQYVWIVESCYKKRLSIFRQSLTPKQSQTSISVFGKEINAKRLKRHIEAKRKDIECVNITRYALAD